MNTAKEILPQKIFDAFAQQSAQVFNLQAELEARTAENETLKKVVGDLTKRLEEAKPAKDDVPTDTTETEK